MTPGAEDLSRLEPWVGVVLYRAVDWLRDLEQAGLVKVRVTGAGLALLAKDGLVRVEGADHVQDCEVVQLRARGARRRGECTCGAAS